MSANDPLRTFIGRLADLIFGHKFGRMTLRIIIRKTPSDPHREAILSPFLAYNESQAGPSGYKPVAIRLKDENDKSVGGLSLGSGRAGRHQGLQRL